MKKLLHVLTIVFLAMIGFVDVQAMEPVPEQYGLVHVIKSQQDRREFISFVKEVSDKYLVFFDYSGYGQLWDLTGDPIFINFLQSVKTGNLVDTFKYLDPDGKLLLVSFDDDYRPLTKKIYVHHIEDSKSSLNTESLEVNYRFALLQKPDGGLIIGNKENKSFAEISFRWQDCLYGSGVTEPLQEKMLDESKLENVFVQNSGEIRNRIQLGRSWGMPQEYHTIFDTSLLSQELMNEITCGASFASSVLCYHKTKGDMFYCGHDGYVTVWKRKK